MLVTTINVMESLKSMQVGETLVFPIEKKKTVNSSTNALKNKMGFRFKCDALKSGYRVRRYE